MWRFLRVRTAQLVLVHWSFWSWCISLFTRDFLFLFLGCRYWLGFLDSSWHIESSTVVRVRILSLLFFFIVRLLSLAFKISISSFKIYVTCLWNRIICSWREIKILRVDWHPLISSVFNAALRCCFSTSSGFLNLRASMWTLLVRYFTTLSTGIEIGSCITSRSRRRSFYHFFLSAKRGFNHFNFWVVRSLATYVWSLKLLDNFVAVITRVRSFI